MLCLQDVFHKSDFLNCNLDFSTSRVSQITEIVASSEIWSFRNALDKFGSVKFWFSLIKGPILKSKHGLTAVLDMFYNIYL